MTDVSPAMQALDRMGIPYRIFVHTQPPESLEDAARQRGQAPDQVIRSILFRAPRKDFFLVLMAGPGQISWRKLRAWLGSSRISMATEEEVLAVTGCVLGTVTPLGLPSPLRLLADVSVFHPQEVSIGSGVRGTALILKSADLRRALGKVETGIFA
jgi:prolyl-tRNA editing enzyme YbaK/EbsC (Cys-tRNA(Pro) deacylase)